mmetsp:Transcript_25978/g.42627  ORF Transcript_25978/g.42627 Transcript_25978/m.42627 type:complete len:404 (-) Transcript_25978:380-1591(-)
MAAGPTPYLSIALLSWESLYSVAVGGVAAHVTELAAGLQRKGHEVHVFVRMGENQQPYEVIHGVHVHRVAISLHADFVTEMDMMGNSMMWSIGETESFMNRKFDIVHGHDWLVVKCLVQAKNIGGRKTVLSMHSTEYGRCGNTWHPHGQSARIRSFEAEGCYVADRVIAVSGALCDEVKFQYQVPDWKLRCVYNGINVHRFDGFVDAAPIKHLYGIGALEPVVLYVGRLTSQKGTDLLIEAIPRVLRHRSDAKFVIVGDGDMRRGLEGRVHEMGVQHAVRFLGAKSSSDIEVINLFKICDCVCMPSRNEPFGIVMLETWAAGKPLVATRQGGPGEIVSDGQDGYLTSVDVDGIAGGISGIFHNFAHSQWMGSQGRAKAAFRFSWDAIAEKTLEVYTELAKPHL